MFDSDEPTIYYFPAKNEPDLILSDPDDNTTQTCVEITKALMELLVENVVSQVLVDRCIFSTAKGYIGLGPIGMVEDDEVVVFEGS